MRTYNRHDLLDARRHQGEDDEMAQGPCTLAFKTVRAMSTESVWTSDHCNHRAHHEPRVQVKTGTMILFTSMQELGTARPSKRSNTISPLHMNKVTGQAHPSRRVLSVPQCLQHLQRAVSRCSQHHHAGTATDYVEGKVQRAKSRCVDPRDAGCLAECSQRNSRQDSCHSSLDGEDVLQAEGETVK